MLNTITIVDYCSNYLQYYKIMITSTKVIGGPQEEPGGHDEGPLPRARGRLIEISSNNNDNNDYNDSR